MQKKASARYLKEKNDPMIEMVKEMKAYRLLMPGRNNTNKNNYDIYTMRHI